MSGSVAVRRDWGDNKVEPLDHEFANISRTGRDCRRITVECDCRMRFGVDGDCESHRLATVDGHMSVTSSRCPLGQHGMVCPPSRYLCREIDGLSLPGWVRDVHRPVALHPPPRTGTALF